MSGLREHPYARAPAAVTATTDWIFWRTTGEPEDGSERAERERQRAEDEDQVLAEDASVFDRSVAPTVAAAVSDAAVLQEVQR